MRTCANLRTRTAHAHTCFTKLASVYPSRALASPVVYCLQLLYINRSGRKLLYHQHKNSEAMTLNAKEDARRHNILNSITEVTGSVEVVWVRRRKPRLCVSPQNVRQQNSSAKNTQANNRTAVGSANSRRITKTKTKSGARPIMDIRRSGYTAAHVIDTTSNFLFTLRKTTSVSVSDSFTKKGAMRLQGPHQVAWKSITTYRIF